MALGNNNSMAQIKGKNKAVMVKRRKEVVAAVNFKAFPASPPQSGPNACGYSGALSKTLYHNGTGLLPQVNDIVYESKRAFSPNSFPGGNYKVDGCGGRFKSFTI